MVTPSRRTGPAAERILRAVLSGLPADVWDGVGENPLFRLSGLGRSRPRHGRFCLDDHRGERDGKPVHILELPGGSAKFDRFHEAMSAAGVIRPFTGQLDNWSYPPRDDTATAGAQIRDMLKERGLWPY